LLEGLLEFWVNLGQTKVDNHSSPGIRIVQEVARFDISVVDTEILEIFEPNQQFIDVVFDLFNSEGVEEGLNLIRITMKGLNLKYSSTMWVMSW
jgi:hypothetical protein